LLSALSLPLTPALPLRNERRRSADCQTPATGEAQIFLFGKGATHRVKENRAGKNISSVFNKPDFFITFFFFRNPQCLSVVAKKVKAAF